MNPFYFVLIIDGIVLLAVLAYKGLEVRKLLSPDLIKAYIVMPNKKLAVHYVKRNKTAKGWQIRIKSHKVAYHIDPECFNFMGVLRMPTGIWNYEHADMINMQSLKASSLVASNDYNAQTEHHVFNDLLATLNKPMLSAIQSMFILILIVVGGFLLIYQQTDTMNKSIRSIQAQVEAINQELVK